MSNFSSLKTNRNKVTDDLTKELEKLNTKTAYDNDNEQYWEPTVDKAGNGQAIIRFLPPPNGEDMPFVRYWEHSFKGPTGVWYIERSLSSLGQDDPCSESNSILWNSGIEENKKIARDRKRKLRYVSNIYVVKDFGNPENDGKVFKFKYGKKIFDKINDIMRPEFEGDAKINPFDLWEGANFRLRIRNVENYRNYDKSEFEAVSSLKDDDGELETIWKTQYSLSEVVDPSKFKSYDALKTRLDKAIGGGGRSLASKSSETKFASKSNPSWVDPDDENETGSNPDKEDDDMSYFKTLAART